LSKLLTRLLPAFGLAFAFFTVGHETRAPSVCLAIAAGIAAIAVGLQYKRRGPDRSPCVSCPERGGLAACSGFRPIVLREKALMRRAGTLIKQRPPAAAGRLVYSKRRAGRSAF
jgi:hypothetical protein